MANEGSIVLHPHHHISTGDISFQVENTVFRVHRHFLIQHSSVLRDMFSLCQTSSSEGTEECPVQLSGDKAIGWELLLNSIYRDNPLVPVQYTRKGCLDVLYIAHKYLMEGIQGEITRRLEEANGTEELVQLMIAARIVDSDTLCEKALNGLIYSKPKITWEQAQCIGFQATYVILSSQTRQTLEHNESSSNFRIHDDDDVFQVYSPSALHPARRRINPPLVSGYPLCS